MRIAIVLIVGAVSTGCEGARSGDGPLSQFAGEYRIVDVGDSESASSEPFGPLVRMPRLPNRINQMFAGDSGAVHIQPAVGGEYVEWSVTFNDPRHEVRMLIGPKNADGSFPAWRFEQQPAPNLRHEGTARITGNRIVADFAVTGGDAARRRLVREEWRVSEDTLEFSLAGGVEGETFTRVGGFTAMRR